MNFLSDLSYLQNKNILIAVSGGVDSMVLMDHLEKNNFIYDVVHINHQTRGEENEKEYELVKSICEANNRRLYTFRFKKVGEGNFHEEARNFRHERYQQLVGENNYNCVLLAHHLDDQIENILMDPHKIAPSLMAETIKIGTIEIRRPFLHVFKEEIYAYASKNKIKYLEDSSNLKMIYKRNNIRSQIKNFTRTKKTQILKDAQMKEAIIREARGYENLNINVLVTKDKEEQKLICYGFLKGTLKNIQVDYKTVEQMLNLMPNEGTKIITLKNKKECYLYNNFFTFEFKYDLKKYYKLCKQKYPDGLIRNMQIGDRVKFPNYSKKLSRLFIEKKIPKNLRIKWPIVEKNGIIIYVPELFERK